ncbi:aromatic amino acid transport protein aroP [Drepanopeziza brunnea f. sp. 'multigermtubi' MB_m1]|uniref:Aromatic amino acid transport protein aroP n=1 Tax=Marssonina brunnea f. sp. multigermtubi (strain MB_m1) TaxID=1072389 RepID=K1XHZ0_MARBU|nr:aromatic amino acid transport protein aroP [Drepanopeziza brunnea f. sp. 'multigermtubi' MB_m1]EKD12064.1 aromatic amino acid transport protein aroP [Drepanopeziza brunnea f. sp. 'multigermtubi' MB_m1]
MPYISDSLYRREYRDILIMRIVDCDLDTSGSWETGDRIGTLFCICRSEKRGLLNDGSRKFVPGLKYLARIVFPAQNHVAALCTSPRPEALQPEAIGHLSQGQCFAGRYVNGAFGVAVGYNFSNFDTALAQFEIIACNIIHRPLTIQVMQLQRVEPPLKLSALCADMYTFGNPTAVGFGAKYWFVDAPLAASLITRFITMLLGGNPSHGLPRIPPLKRLTRAPFSELSTAEPGSPGRYLLGMLLCFLIQASFTIHCWT